MPRYDDIGDMPSLMPDSDEIKRTPEQSFSASKGGTANVGNAHVEGSDGSSRRPSWEGGRPIAAPRAMHSSAPQIVAKSSGILWFLVVTMFVGVLGGGYWSYNKLTDVDLMLTVSRGELDHARKRIGELEALVVATDVNSNKSGTVVQAQVRLIDNRAKERNKFVDTEIDKLWGVTYRTNRPAIAESQKAIDNNTATVKQHQDQLKTQNERVELQQSALAQQQAQIGETSQASQLAIQSVQDQLYKVELLQDKLASVLKQVALQEKTLSDQNKTDLGQAQLAQQHAKDLAALTTSLKGLAKQIGSSTTDDNVSLLTSRLGVLENNARVITAIEQNASEIDERVYLLEQSSDSVNAFRRDTSRSLDQLQSQIRNLAYGE
jgi:uncharacterized protein (DUF3084 family)